MIFVTPRNVDQYKGGLETIVKHLKQNRAKNTITQVYSFKTLLYLIMRKEKHDRILFFNIYNKNYLFYFIILKIFYFQKSFEIMPLWHDPVLQSGGSNSVKTKIKEALRVAWNQLINQWFIRRFDKVYYYSDYEHSRLPAKSYEVVAGPLRQKHNVSMTNRKEYDFVFVGRLSRNKGVELFIELAKRLPHRKFLIITPELSNLFETKNLTILRGLDDVQMFCRMAEARMLICPSYYESYSIVCQDAIMLNLGVIASKNVHGKQHFSKYNYFKLFEKMSVDSIISAIKDLEIVMQNETPDAGAFLNETSKFSAKFGIDIV